MIFDLYATFIIAGAWLNMPSPTADTALLLMLAAWYVLDVEVFSSQP